jgi:hypothetical protein
MRVCFIKLQQLFGTRELEELVTLEGIRDGILDHLRRRSAEAVASLRRRLEGLGSTALQIEIEVLQTETLFVQAQLEVYQNYIADYPMHN